MKKEETNLAPLFLMVTLVPALLISIIYFASTHNLNASHEEALRNGFGFSLVLMFVITALRAMFDKDLDLIYVSLFAIAVTSIALTAIFFGFNNIILMTVISILGITLSLAASHSLNENNLRTRKTYSFIFFSIIGGCLVNYLISLALSNQLNLLLELAQHF